MVGLVPVIPFRMFCIRLSEMPGTRPGVTIPNLVGLASETLPARIAERETGKRGLQINIERHQDHDDHQNGEHDFAFGRHGYRKRFTARWFSHPLDKTIHHAFLAGAVELDGQLVAVDRGDVAVAEFLMEHAVAE